MLDLPKNQAYIPCLDLNLEIMSTSIALLRRVQPEVKLSPEARPELPVLVDAQLSAPSFEDLCTKRKVSVMEIVKKCLGELDSASTEASPIGDSPIDRATACVKKMLEPIKSDDDILGAVLVENTNYALAYLEERSDRLRRRQDVFGLRCEVEEAYGSLIMQICTKKKKTAA